ncbi:hypothetical protein SRDD_44940 [Serratia sp. DD3]|nr:hypothetical protein SRDD_44940 [Serratia sp. DD3]
MLTIEINKLFNSTLHPGSLRRWLPRAGIVWRRAAPTLHIRDPHKEEKLATIETALNNNSPEHPVFYEDEVDIDLNPKIGADWQKRVNRNASLHRARMKNIISQEPFMPEPVGLIMSVGHIKTRVYSLACYAS